MTSRLLGSARLAARLATSSIRPRAAAAASLRALPALSSAPSSVRYFAHTSTSLLSEKPDEPSSAPAVDEPTPSEADVRADQSGINPLASEATAFAEVAPTESEEDVRADQAALGSSSSAEAKPISDEYATESEADVRADHSTVDPIAAAKELNSRTVFVGGLSWNVDNEWLRDEVAKLLEDADAVVATRVARDPMGKSKGFGFIELATPELASKLSTLTAEIDHRVAEFRLSVERSERPVRTRASETGGPRNPPSPTIWAGNLVWTAEESEVEELFEQFGTVRRVSIPRDAETGRARGIAYIEFEDLDSAQAAFEAGANRELAINDRPLRLDYAATPTRPTYGGARGGPRTGRGSFAGRDGGRGGAVGGGRREGGRREGGGNAYGGRREGGRGRDRDDQW